MPEAGAVVNELVLWCDDLIKHVLCRAGAQHNLVPDGRHAHRLGAHVNDVTDGNGTAYISLSRVLSN